MSISRLVLASSNEGKLREFRRLLEPLAIEVIAQAELGIPMRTSLTRRSSRMRWPKRDTRAGSAIARAGRRFRTCACARSAGPRRAERPLCRRAEIRHAQQREADRRAAGESPTAARITRACLCCAARRRPEPILADGAWHGTIVDSPRGTGGFGYDPHFEDAATGMTGAELPLAQKNELSHRGKAMRALIEKLCDER